MSLRDSLRRLEERRAADARNRAQFAEALRVEDEAIACVLAQLGSEAAEILAAHGVPLEPLTKHVVSYRDGQVPVTGPDGWNFYGTEALGLTPDGVLQTIWRRSGPGTGPRHQWLPLTPPGPSEDPAGSADVADRTVTRWSNEVPLGMREGELMLLNIMEPWLSKPFEGAVVHGVDRLIRGDVPRRDG